MSYYIKTKLSLDDKDILEDIYEELEEITIPTTYRKEKGKGPHHSIKTGTTTQKNARQTVFGLTTYQGKRKVKVL